MKVVTEGQLVAFLSAVADKYQMSTEEKSAWVGHHVMSALRGNVMQSIGYLDYHYLQRFNDGRVIFGAEFTHVCDTPAMTILDAGGAIGALAGIKAMDLAIKKAKKVGVGVVSVRNSNDWGMHAYYVSRALDQGCIGFIMANSRPEVAPYGGIDAVFGHDAYAVALPTERHYPVLIDMASSDCGGVKGQEDLMLGRGVPAGVFVDANGAPLNDISQWGTHLLGYGVSQGAQIMKSYKELCLAMSVEGLAGALSGMKCALDLKLPEPSPDGVREPRGQFVMAIDINQFTPLDEYKAKIDRVIDQAKSSRLMNGFDEILMPGERGYRESEKRKREGIPYPLQVWERVEQAARTLEIDLKSILQAV